MTVWYILMAFPLPSETFVCNDIRALRRLGLAVEAHALLPRRPDADHMLAERSLADLTVSHADARAVAAGLAAAATRPLLVARVLAWLLRLCWNHPVHLAKSLALLPRCFEVLKRAERDRPDVIHLYWGHYPAILAWLVQRRLPRIVVSVTLSSYDLLRRFPGSAAVARRADLVSTWAAANLPDIARMGVPQEEVLVLHQGLDLEQLANRSFTKRTRRVVTAARLVKEKGMDDALQAFATVAAAFPDATLEVLGDGPDRRRLERVAAQSGLADRVTFRGHVAHADVFAAMEQAEVFLLMSRYEGERLPNVVKEAMACRCLCVLTYTPGTEELMDDGIHGWVQPPGDVTGVADRVVAAFTDPARAAAMVEAAARRVRDRFDLMPLMGRYAERWQRLVASRASGSS